MPSSGIACGPGRVADHLQPAASLKTPELIASGIPESKIKEKGFSKYGPSIRDRVERRLSR